MPDRNAMTPDVLRGSTSSRLVVVLRLELSDQDRQAIGAAEGLAPGGRAGYHRARRHLYRVVDNHLAALGGDTVDRASSPAAAQDNQVDAALGGRGERHAGRS